MRRERGRETFGVVAAQWLARIASREVVDFGSGVVHAA
jgi:hypothetical protein